MLYINYILCILENKGSIDVSILPLIYLQGYYITFKPVENFCIIVIWISVEDMKNVKL